jgi:hypothetical protein
MPFSNDTIALYFQRLACGASRRMMSPIVKCPVCRKVALRRGCQGLGTSDRFPDRRDSLAWSASGDAVVEQRSVSRSSIPVVFGTPTGGTRAGLPMQDHLRLCARTSLEWDSPK